MISLSFLSYFVFSTSFIIKNQYIKEGIKNSKNNSLEKKEEIIKELYINYLNEKAQEKGCALEDYILKLGEDEIWKKNYDDKIPTTDAGYQIEIIYRLEKISSDTKERKYKIYEKGGTKPSNYFGIIRNLSIVGVNYINLKLKNINDEIKIGAEIYKGEINYYLDIIYSFTSNKEDIVIIKKVGDMNVRIY